MWTEQSLAEVRKIRSKQAGGKNIYTVSSANLLDSATTLWALRWSVKDHVELARATGMDGVEYWFTNPLSNFLRPHLGQDGPYLPYVLSAHQSPRGEHLFGIPQALAKALIRFPVDPQEAIDSLRRYLGVYLVWIDPEGSLREAEQLFARLAQVGLANYFTINTYTDPRLSPLDRWMQVPNRVVQTYPGAIADLNINDPKEMIDLAKALEFKWCISTHHIQKLDWDWKMLIPMLMKAGVVAQAHIEVFRTDVSTDRTQTIKAGLEMLTTKATTPEKQMVHLMAETGPVGNITLEALSGGMINLGPGVREYYQEFREKIGHGIFRD